MAAMQIVQRNMDCLVAISSQWSQNRKATRRQRLGGTVSYFD
jgi:hypothetical protein